MRIMSPFSGLCVWDPLIITLQRLAMGQHEEIRRVLFSFWEGVFFSFKVEGQPIPTFWIISAEWGWTSETNWPNPIVEHNICLLGTIMVNSI